MMNILNKYTPIEIKEHCCYNNKILIDINHD